MCHHKRCSVLAPLGKPLRARDKPSINRIAAEFVAGMQAALPSVVPTILRTASKLKVYLQIIQGSDVLACNSIKGYIILAQDEKSGARVSANSSRCNATATHPP